MENIVLSHDKAVIDATIPLSSSKSESNRALIIKALCKDEITLTNLAEARDTQTMIRLLSSSDDVLDVLDAGTTMRFLTAYRTATNQPATMTGTPRMCDRPIKLLVDALRQIGAEISCLDKDGYPPHKIEKFEQSSDTVSINGGVSSQYISALLMIAPTLPQGLHIKLEGEVASRPYIEMTRQLMQHFGVASTWEGDTISVAPQEYKSMSYMVESDWSGASYWYSIAALSPAGSKLKVIGLKSNSLQGDSALVEIMETLGVHSEFVEDGVILTQKETVSDFVWDFTHCPDLAQTISVVVAAKGIKGRLTGLHSLRIKETDRIAAIETELTKLGAQVKVEGDDAIEIEAGKLDLGKAQIHTYEDHRMAMAFAPLALFQDIVIEDPSVVNKSYPSFWAHLEIAGFASKEA